VDANGSSAEHLRPIRALALESTNNHRGLIDEHPDFSAPVARHRTYFRTGATRSAEWRERQLTALRTVPALLGRTA
jgi:hypothetical protein